MSDLKVTFTITDLGDDLKDPGQSFDEPHEALWDRLYVAEEAVVGIFKDDDVLMEVERINDL